MHTCQAVLDGNECGLWAGHEGDHTPHQIGKYLATGALLTPLHLLPLQIRGQHLYHCPLCGTALNSWLTDLDSIVFYMDVDGDRPPTREHFWTFWPCFCHGRQVTENHR
ncbi:hypothetical protein ACIA7S_28665 [Streptomyces sp. NPDC051643]|uniref:hypothetical protein n=1 Tax=Streptomyces sp. NPDC051643 TaxID=3365665 RepID=UPI0037A3B628